MRNVRSCQKTKVAIILQTLNVVVTKLFQSGWPNPILRARRAIFELCCRGLTGKLRSLKNRCLNLKPHHMALGSLLLLRT